MYLILLWNLRQPTVVGSPLSHIAGCLHPPPSAPYDNDIDHSNADLEAGRAFPFPIHLRTTHQVKIIVCCLVGQGLYMVINSIPFDSISSSMMAEEINKMKRSRYHSPNFFPFIALIICRVRSPNWMSWHRDLGNSAHCQKQDPGRTEWTLARQLVRSTNEDSYTTYRVNQITNFSHCILETWRERRE